ncbi:MAG: class I SAM-dependent methyltransferase [Proteobacteria bacterium]|nr:class I SAM-dependent methyltransferase [Pseudomonadota bacterium]
MKTVSGHRFQTLDVLETEGFEGYELLDSGGGRKLERFGAVIVDRPEPQALWKPRLEAERWKNADAVFSAADDEEAGKWRRDRPGAESWPVKLQSVTLLARLSGFRHLGLFPEQLPHWQWMVAEIERARARTGIERPRVLNLFAYTGAASLLAARAGAEVVHVDASKKAVGWARENQAASKLGDAPIRWIVEDARKFVAREVRRGRGYHVILVDPPKFGRGPNGEVWDLFEHLAPLLGDCAQLADKQSSAMVLTVYAIRASALAFAQLSAEVLEGRGGKFEAGELAIREAGGGRAVPTSLFTRWTSHGA